MGNRNETFEIDLKIYDSDGDVVDGTTATLTLAQISDIVDHASQLIVLRRQGLVGELEGVMDELDEALSASAVITSLDMPRQTEF